MFKFLFFCCFKGSKSHIFFFLFCKKRNTVRKMSKLSSFFRQMGFGMPFQFSLFSNHLKNVTLNCVISCLNSRMKKRKRAFHFFRDIPSHFFSISSEKSWKLTNFVLKKKRTTQRKKGIFSLFVWVKTFPVSHDVLF